MGGISDSPFDIVGDAHFTGSVNDVLEMINSYPVGRAVIGEVRKLGRVRIEPFPGGFNADTGPNNEADKKDDKIKVRFSPTTFTWSFTILGHTLKDARTQWPGMKVDEVLIHELVHAVNGLGPGINTTTPTGKMAVYTIYDDFFAILVTNMFESEKGSPPSLLRNTHALTSAGMQDWEAISEIFLFMDNHFPWVKKFCAQNNHFAHILARSHARFNPLRAYFAIMAEPDDYEWPIPDLSDVSTSAEPIRVSEREVAHETRPPLSNAVWIDILQKRFRADDVAGYTARARQLQRLAAHANAIESLPMFARLLLRPPGDLVAKLFHDNLSTPLRKRVLNQLRRNLGRT